MKLNVKAFALTGGILWGGAMFLATVWLLVIGSPGETVGLLGKFFLGYNLSYVGAVVGLFWGFVDGVIGSGLFAWLYNKLAG